MKDISRHILGKALVVALLCTGMSVLIAASVVPVLGGSYDGLGMWLSVVCPFVIALPASTWQFLQSERLRKARDELSALHAELDRAHSNLKAAHAALEERVRHDAMTGGLTREAFFSELERARAEGRSGALLLADADHFKRINDNFGHQTGDDALIAIAAAIVSATGTGDFWGRIGGEEFAIFLEGSSPAAAAAVAEAIRTGVEAISIRRETERVPVSISIGGIGVAAGFSTRQAVSDADRQLYRAKRSGRNRVIFGKIADGDANAA